MEEKKRNIHQSITEPSILKIFPLRIHLFPYVQGPLLKVASQVRQSFIFSLISTLLPVAILTDIPTAHSQAQVLQVDLRSFLEQA